MSILELLFYYIFFFCQLEVHMGFTIEVSGVLSLDFSLVFFFLNGVYDMTRTVLDGGFGRLGD
jgi:hypothetical protein